MGLFKYTKGKENSKTNPHFAFVPILIKQVSSLSPDLFQGNGLYARSAAELTFVCLKTTSFGLQSMSYSSKQGEANKPLLPFLLPLISEVSIISSS